jgi:hypothetical protein
MAREVREEVGLEVVGTARMLGLYARFRHGSSDHVSVFVVDEWSGTPEIDGLEIAEFGFFQHDDVPSDTTPATRRRLAEALSGNESRNSGDGRTKNCPRWFERGRPGQFARFRITEQERVRDRLKRVIRPSLGVSKCKSFSFSFFVTDRSMDQLRGGTIAARFELTRD